VGPLPSCHVVTGTTLPGRRDLRFLLGDGGRPLRRLNGPIHLLTDLAGPQRDEVLPLATDQDVLLVLALLLRAVRESHAAIAVALVVGPFSLVLQPVRALAHPKARPLVVLPLADVDLGGGGIDVVFDDRELGFTLAQADGGVDVAGSGADRAHPSFAPERALLAPLAGQGALGLGLTELEPAQQRPSEDALLLALEDLGVAVGHEDEATPGNGGAASHRRRGVGVQRRAVGVLAAQGVDGRPQG